MSVLDRYEVLKLKGENESSDYWRIIFHLKEKNSDIEASFEISFKKTAEGFYRDFFIRLEKEVNRPTKEQHTFIKGVLHLEFEELLEELRRHPKGRTSLLFIFGPISSPIIEEYSLSYFEKTTDPITVSELKAFMKRNNYSYPQEMMENEISEFKRRGFMRKRLEKANEMCAQYLSPDEIALLNNHFSTFIVDQKGTDLFGYFPEDVTYYMEFYLSSMDETKAKQDFVSALEEWRG